MDSIQCCTRLNNGVDRISLLPDEIIVVILSFLTLREAATTSVLSSRWVYLWKCTSNIKSDRISWLPESIIGNILSFLQFKTAVSTSVLCSRWPNSWKYTTDLDFNSYRIKLGKLATKEGEMEMCAMHKRGIWDVERCEYIQLVNSVISSHKAPSLKRFSISFYVDQSAKCIVAKWLQFAFSRGVEILVLDFKCIAGHHKVSLEESLRESGLCSSPQTLILFKSLKRLCLRDVKVSGEAVKIFLRNCPLLELLTILISLLSRIEVCRLFLESVPKLVDVEFGSRKTSIDYAQDVASALFHLSSQLEFLKLTIPCPSNKVFLANEFGEMSKLRKLVVRYSGVRAHSLLPVTALVWAAPRLEVFRLEFDEIRRNGDAAMEVRRYGERCRHALLKCCSSQGLSMAPLVTWNW
ncbi:UDP-glycosyltransferase [Orobanche hederae]